MGNVNKLEIETQRRLIDKIFVEKLGYTYLGNFEDRENNKNVEEELLLKYLTKIYGEQIAKQAIYEFMKVVNDDSLDSYEVNKNVYSKLKYGVDVSIVGEKDKTVYLIDYNEPFNNDFYIAEEVTVIENNEKRPDLVIYINGIAIAVIELKRSTVSINEGIRQNCDNQEEIFIKKFFATIQLVIAGNDTEGLMYGTTGTPAKYYLKWTEDKNALGEVHEVVENLIDKSSYLIDQQITSIFYKNRIVDLINNFIIFDSGIKKVPRYNQYFGVSNARIFAKNREGGIFWHTQGSGKSLSMVWIAKWILSNIDNSRIVIFTDRKELDKQIKEVFQNAEEGDIYRAKSSMDLLNQLNVYNKRIICSLIHKVGRSVDEESDKEYEDFILQLNAFKNDSFSAKGEIFVFVDECHRTNAGKLHDEMKRILPSATFFGFTGTPLLKRNKATTLEKFGRYIHTYKFDQAVDDGVVVDLRYESRNVEQYIGNQRKIDEWFEAKTEGLNEYAKERLKDRWATLQNITSTNDRLEEIVKDIIFDFEKIPRLKEGKGNAILVASSIYEACKYYRLFQEKGFDKCVIVSSYTPNISDIKGESIGEGTISDKELIFETYDKMWNKSRFPKLRSDSEYDDKSTCFEDYQIEKFKKEPGRMKLLIVVDRMLTGFDAPHATYLYIDKSMHDHGLFQAICRVNRLDDEKDLGYIIDYKNLFESIEGAVTDYTSGAFEDYDKEDINGLLVDRIKSASERLNEARNNIKRICEPVPSPKDTLDYLHYFVAEELNISVDLQKNESKRLELYDAVTEYVRSYTNIADDMTKAGYTKDEINDIKYEVNYYNNVRDEVMKAAGDYIELKNYDSAMRYMIDNYIKADPVEEEFKIEEATLLDIITASGLEKAKNYLPKTLAKKDEAVALAIEANIASVISENANLNPRYYTKMSELLNELIKIKQQQFLDYKEYLLKLIELAKKVASPEYSGEYPVDINTHRLRGIYDIVNKDESLTKELYTSLSSSIPEDFMDSPMKQRQLINIIKRYISDDNKVNEIFELWKNTRGF